MRQKERLNSVHIGMNPESVPLGSDVGLPTVTKNFKEENYRSITRLSFAEIIRQRAFVSMVLGVSLFTNLQPFHPDPDSKLS